MVRLKQTLLILVSFALLFWISILYGYGYNDSAYDENVAVKELNLKIDMVEKELHDNKSFLSKLQTHIEAVIAAKQKSQSVSHGKITFKPNTPPHSKIVIPVVVFAYNRPSVTRCLDLLIKYRKEADADFPIVVSQDGNHVETTKAIERYADQITHLRHPEELINIPSNHRSLVGYYKISSHYKWGIGQTFSTFSGDSIIILEDDIEIAPDFFSYFRALHSLLMKDDSLYCVSAWNDNGKQGLIDTSASSLLYRSDFFPGLGWMLKRSTWEEMRGKWPAAFWDDWFRDPQQRRNRACIRPEISRTQTFGKVGVSNGQFFESHLKYILLNDKKIDWSKIDLSYLTRDRYDKVFLDKVYNSSLTSLATLQNGGASSTTRLEFTSSASFKNLAKSLGLMSDFKAGVARTAYHGIVTTFYHGTRVYVAPPRDWNGYDTKWV